jgi:mannose-6-phosphate isomerase
VIALDGAVRDYAWGSATVIQQLLGRPVDGRPIAELWFGAHPDDPAHCPEHGTKLDALIGRDPVGLLGAAVVDAFGPHLPFLVKILAAETPLSIQAHPDREQARAGFAAEDAAGIPRDAPERTYRDANHKPELLCALTEFDALCGFRPVGDTLRLLDALAVPELDDVAALLAGPDPLRAAFTHLLTLPEPAPLAAAVVAAAPRLGGEWDEARRAVELGAQHFPHDVGVVLTLLLNAVRLQPGEAIFLPAGNVHAYLRGTGVEVMANSDNVLRCGFTPKHVDVPELLRVTDFRELREPRADDSGEPGAFTGLTDDFAVLRLDLDAYRKPGRDAGSCALGDAGKPYLLVSTSGTATVSVEGAAAGLTPAHAVFVPAREAAFTVRGTGTLYAVTVGNVRVPEGQN